MLFILSAKADGNRVAVWGEWATRLHRVCMRPPSLTPVQLSLTSKEESKNENLSMAIILPQCQPCQTPFKYVS